MVVAGGFILVAILGLSYGEWAEYRRASSEVARSRDISDTVNRLLANVLDAESGRRGFVLTGNERYLEPYNRAVQLVPVELNDLNKLLVPAPPELPHLNTLVDQKLAELRQSIDLRRSQGMAPALEVMLNARGREAMDQIRRLAADIQRTEESSHAGASRDRETAAQRAFLATLFGSTLLLAILILGRITVNRAILAREQSFADAQKARDSLRTTITSIGDAVIATDEAGRIVLSNKVAQSLLRAAEGDITGRHLDEVFRIINEFSREKVESPVTKVLREGNVAGLANHTVLIARDGVEIPIDDSGAPIRSADGSIHGTVLVFRDITERRRAEGASRLLASIVEFSDDAIISKDLNGIVTSWNKGAERIFGYSADEMIGQPIALLAAPDRADEMPEILERIRRGERVDHFQTVRRTKNGSLIHASITVSPVRDVSGRITGASKILRDITPQVRAQAELAEQRERLRVTLSSIGDAVMATDSAGRVLYLNPVAEQLTGWTLDEAAGRPLEEVFQIVNEESRQTVENPVTKVLREGRTAGLANHTLLITRNGTEIAIDDSAAPIQDARHGVMGVVLVFRDVTKRRAQEQQLARAQDQLAQDLSGVRSLLQLGDRLMQTGDLRSLLGEILATAEAISGADKGHVQLLGEDGVLRIATQHGLSEQFLEFFRSVHEQEAACGTALARRERIVVEDVEQSFIFAGKPSLKVLLDAGVHAVQCTPMITHTGAVVGVLSTHYRLPHMPSERDLRLMDLLARQAADLIDKFRAEEAVRRSEERLLAILNHLPVGIALLDTDGEYLIRNSAWKQVVNGGVSPLDGQESERWRATTAGGHPLPDEEYPALRALRGEDVLPGIDFQHRREDGEERWIRFSALPLRSPEGRITGALAMLQDVEVERRAEERRVELLVKERALATEQTLRETEAELARVGRALSVSELAASIAHEVNQPLAGVVTNAEAGLLWLSGEAPNIREARASLALIVRDGNRASAIIRRIREFLSKETQLQASLDVNQLIQDAVALVQHELLKRRVDLRVNLARELPRIRGDQIQLQQVVFNLLMNGMEAMAAVDGPKEMLVTSARSADGRITVAVRDSGTGIHPQDIQRIFEAFFTTKIRGMGMGLSISRSIIESHGGRIWAALNDGRGLTVQFAIPPEAYRCAASNPS